MPEYLLLHSPAVSSVLYALHTTPRGVVHHCSCGRASEISQLLPGSKISAVSAASLPGSYTPFSKRHRPRLPQPLQDLTEPEQLLLKNRQQLTFESIELPGRSRRLLGRPAANPALCSLLQLRPVPSSPTVVRTPPPRFTGMFSEAPRPPTEIELSPPLEKLNRSGPRRAERRNRNPMA
jgi:hypothetical protein